METVGMSNINKQRGFTLIEIAIVLVIIGLLLGGVLKGQELITSARVRNLISQQDGIKAAYFGFLDRYRALPGDYTGATNNITGVSTAACNGGNGNGNGQIETAVNNEDILAWEHLSKAGFINGTYTCAAAVAPGTNPTNPYAIALQVSYDGAYGTAGGPLRHNLKTGNQIPVDIMAEVDRKIDDGQPNTGGFQFSAYTVAGGVAPTSAALASPSCTSAASAAGLWNTTNGSTNCGGASLF
jgi:prepilin-type N-terminal cleavage/methylation domain-containing protein